MANMKLITSKSVPTDGTTSITFTSIPNTYTDLKLVISVRKSDATTLSSSYMTFNGSSSNYSMRRLYGSGAAASDSFGTTSIYIGSTNSATSTSNTFSSAEITIPNYAGSNYKSMSVDMVMEDNSSGGYQFLITGLWSNTAAITSITFTGDADYVTGSTFYLYGISNVTTGSKATGGVVSYDSTYYYHMFPYSGTFTPTQSISADILVIAGGGGGGRIIGGGGGAGGLLGFNSQSLTATNYTITVGGGGAGKVVGSYGNGTNGDDSQFGSLTLVKGGGGGAGGSSNAGNNGGSGGGGRDAYAGGTPTSDQGFAGGAGGSVSQTGAGGGGAGAAGSSGTGGGSGKGGDGGIGLSTYSTWATATNTGVGGYYAGGGGGAKSISGATDATRGLGGLGGGGNSGYTDPGTDYAAVAGTANTGGGGGGAPNNYLEPSAVTQGKNGGSGLVIIRYAI